MSTANETTKRIMNELAEELAKKRPNEKRLEKLNAQLDDQLGTGLKAPSRSDREVAKMLGES